MTLRHPLYFLALLLLPLLGACSSPLQHNLDEPQANDMLVLLHQAGIQAEKIEGSGTGRWTLHVPTPQQDQAWTLLRAYGLPRHDHTDAQDDNPLLPSAAQEQVRLQNARAKQLETSLYTLPGVLTARVHLVLPTHDPLAQTQPTPRASVLLLTHDPKTLPSKAELQTLTASAVDGLQTSQVALLIHQAPVPPTPTIENNPLATLPHNSTLAALLIVILMQALAILWLLWRRRAANPQTGEQTP